MLTSNNVFAIVGGYVCLLMTDSTLDFWADS